MKSKILSLDGMPGKEIELPEQFSVEYRPDLIQRAVLAIQSHKRQPYGASPDAGTRYSAEVSKRRRQYRGCYGKGISRVQRKIMSRRGLHFNWVGAFIPGTVGGRRAHPPKAENDYCLKINPKERRKAICSAIAATAMKEVVEARGHRFKHIPIIVNSSMEKLSKAADVIDTLSKLGLEEELQRAAQKKVRAGRGKSRGRRYRKKKGPLLVVSAKCELQKAAKSIPGVDVAVVSSLNAELLAPGAAAGRLTVWTEDAIEKLGKERLFI